MRIAILLVVGALAAGSARAEVRSYARDNAQYGIGDPHQGPSARGRRPEARAPHCLVRKADGRRVCHSLERWREIAERMDGEPDRRR